MILLILAAAVSAAGQKGRVVEKNVSFARGKSSATVKGVVADRLDSHIFHVSAKAGQTMTVRMTSPRPLRDAHLCVSFPLAKGSTGESLCEQRRYTVKLPRDGDYQIYIEAIRDRIPYTLTISIK